MKNKKLLCSVCFLFAFMSALWGQNITVKGNVISKTDGEPIIGASVIETTATTNGTITDFDGNFTLTVKKGSELTISYIGFKTIKVGAKALLNVTLEEDSEMLDEVVVTGYSTQKKADLTGSVAVVSTKTLKTATDADPMKSLQGKVPGMTITANGSPSGTGTVRIRGIGSFNSSQDPLYVVDGVPTTRALNSLNTNDIESMQVLKDAASASIYGSRASNGVIIITTKKGKAKSKLEISADAYWSVSSWADLDYLFNMASAENQFRFEELMHKYEPINFAGNDPYTRASARRRYMSAPYSMLYERDNKKNLTAEEYEVKKRELIEQGNRGMWKDDLNEYIFQRMVRQQYNVSLRGAAEKLDYAFSASYDDEDSYLQENGKRRMLLNLASNARLTRNLTFEFAVNTMFSREENNGTSVASVREWLSPWTRLKDDEGNFTHISTLRTVYEPLLMSEEYYAGKTPVDWTYNPVADREYTDNYSKTMNYRVQGGFDYRTDWGLNVSAKGQYERRKYDKHVSYEPESFFVRDLYNTYSALGETGRYVSYFPIGGVFSNEGHTYEAYNLRGQADYSLTKDKHAFNVLAGTEVISATTEADPKVTRYGYNKYTNSVLTELDYVTKRNNIFGVSSYMPFAIWL